MKATLDNYKNIDKSTNLLLDVENSFKALYFNNITIENEKFQIKLNDDYIQLYFCTRNKVNIAFNFEHCSISLEEDNSNMVYFKEEKMNILFDLSPRSQLYVILIPIDIFHNLFSVEGNFLFNFKNFKIGQPIIESKKIGNQIKMILNQLNSKNITDSLRSIYIKGKIYELFSYYFSSNTDTDSEYCPYVANEETVSKIIHAKEIIINKMNNPPGLFELAKTVGLNIKKLKNGFKELYGLPVFTFLLNYKMELAKTLLYEQQLNVNEISSHLGYSTSSHFITAFKKKYGITPKQFSKS